MPGDIRQTRRPTGFKIKNPDNGATLNMPGGRPGVGVDAGGAPVIDPTENVLALVDAQARFQKDKDELVSKGLSAEISHVQSYFEMVIRAEQHRMDIVVEAERRRIDDLAALKKDYDKQISETQTGQMKTTSDLVSTQLDKVTTSLSDTINKTADNISAMLATMDGRVAKVEQFRYEMGGRAAVADPAMAQIASDLSALKLAGGRHEGQEAEAANKAIITARAAALELQKTQASSSGNQNVISIVVGIVALLSLLASVGSALYAATRPQAPIPVYQAPTHVPTHLELV